MQHGGVTVGVDVGATLCKLVRVSSASADTAVHPAADIEAIRAAIRAWRPDRIGATGGGGDQLGARLDAIPVHHSDEFSAWGKGVGLVARREQITLPAHHLVASVGTGTSILAVRDGIAERVGGTPLGGGTIVGLGQLLAQQGNFAELVALAAAGDRRRVDLLIGDLHRTAPVPVLQDLSASSFAKLASRTPADLTHAVIGMVGETVALMAGGLARGTGLDTIAYCGSTVHGNPPLRAILEQITTVFGHRPLFLDQGAFCGAFGAAAFAAG